MPSTSLFHCIGWKRKPDALFFKTFLNSPLVFPKLHIITALNETENRQQEYSEIKSILHGA